MSLFCFSLIKKITFSSASSCVSVLDELWPFKCLEVATDSSQSETNFSVSKLSKDRLSILMRIIPSRVSSPNLIHSTDFSLFMQEKPRSQTAVLLLIVIIISSKTVTLLYCHPYGKQTLGTHQLLVSASTFNFFPEIIFLK